MAYFLTRLQVGDYDTWKPQFDMDAPGARTAAQGYRVLRTVDQPGEVYLLVEFATLESARIGRERLLRSGVLKRFDDRTDPVLLEEAEARNYSVSPAPALAEPPFLPPGFIRRPMNRFLVAVLGHTPSRWLRPRRMLLLTTIGRSSGRRRTSPLFYAPGPDADGWIVAGGNYARETMPNWYLNLRANPEHAWVDAGQGRVRVVAETISGPQREGWVRAIPMITELQAATKREIPIVHLTAHSSDALSGS
jgi:F420H(2)-dependent quinone reductase